MSNRDYETDEQTGRTFKIILEGKLDRFTAIVSVIYLLLAFGFFLWQLFDIWVGQYAIAKAFGYSDVQKLSNSSSFRLAIFAFLGGGLGGIVNGFRSFLIWHSEDNGFGHRFIWKYIVAPWLGATLALFTFALIRGGIAVFSGVSSPASAGLGQIMSTFSVGALAGYGAQKVFVWLDAQVVRIFSVSSGKVAVQSLIGKTAEEAKGVLQNLNLKLGQTTTEAQTDSDKIGKVIRQTPAAGISVDSNTPVDIVIGSSQSQTKVAVPSLIGKTAEEAKGVLQNLNLKLGQTTTEAQTDSDKIGKVIRQTPAAGISVDSNTPVDIVIGS